MLALGLSIALLFVPCCGIVHLRIGYDLATVGLVGYCWMCWCWVSGCRVGQCVGAGSAVIGFAIGLSVSVGYAAKVLRVAIDHMSAILFLMLQE
ncbi:hypothetical protein U1Q18_019538 [Sarracenia purpurea var. burkii]